MRDPYADSFANRALRQILTAEPQETTTMPKILKKFQHVAKERRGGIEAKYDWKLILSGQNVMLEAGPDYPAEREKEDGTKVPNTPFFARKVIKAADAEDKIADVTFVDADGKGISNPDAAVGIVVTARPMTDEEKQTRDARRAELKAKRAEAEKNGEHPPAETIPETPAAASIGAPA